MMSPAPEANRPARVVIRGVPDKWTCTIEGARDLANRIGHDLFAAFLKCFEGAERIFALEHLMFCSQQVLSRDSYKFDRNLRMLVNFIGATMYEVGEALEQLNGARVVEKMNDRSKWEPLNGLRKLWRNDHRLRTLRNTFGFHLGEPKLYRDGLEAKLQKSDDLVFEHGEGSRRHDGHGVLAVEVLLEAKTIDESWLEAVVDMVQEAHETYPDLLHEVWKEVLVSAGVGLLSEL
jgi:hypothetical protein